MDKYYDLSRLLDFYGEMLSERQRLAMQLYYNDDLSLSEVAEELGISRQGVRASLKKSEEILRRMESKLRLCERFDKSLRDFRRLRSYAEKIHAKGEEICDEQLLEYADEINSFVLSIEKIM